MKSKWCMFETHLAQSRMMLQNDINSSGNYQNSLILILKDKDISVGQLDKNLRYILKTWTYIEWSEKEENQKLFWKRLKASCMTKSNNNITNVQTAGQEEDRSRTLSD